MKYLAVFDDDFLSNFRRDDCGLTLVLTDKSGCTRAVNRTPLQRPILTNTQGISLFLTDGHIDALTDYEREQMIKEIADKLTEDFSKDMLTTEEIRKQFGLPRIFEPIETNAVVRLEEGKE